MFTKAAFLASLAAIGLGQMPPPNCYTGPASPASDCNQFITKFCDLVNPEDLRLGDNNARCYNLPNGNRCDFIVYNTYMANASPSGTNCKLTLQNITNDCVFGGSGQFGAGGYTFTVDPNTGPCSANVQGGS